jgi:hypothetical protein
MECRDCEDFLQLGIEAFTWIERAHGNLRESIYGGKSVFDPEAESLLTELYESWLRPYADAEKWAQAQAQRGYFPDNLTAFRACREKALDVLEQRALAEKARLARMTSQDDD